MKEWVEEQTDKYKELKITEIKEEIHWLEQKPALSYAVIRTQTQMGDAKKSNDLYYQIIHKEKLLQSLKDTTVGLEKVIKRSMGL